MKFNDSDLCGPYLQILPLASIKGSLNGHDQG